MTLRNVIAGFKVTGVCPFDRDAVLVNRSFTIFYCIEVASSQQLRKPANGILCKLLLRLLIVTCKFLTRTC